MYEVSLNEEQIKQIIEAIRVLGGSLKWDLIFYGFIPVVGIIITNVMTYFIYRRQYKNQIESLRKESELQLKAQLTSQQIALKKDLKIKALIDAKNAILDDCRNIGLLRIDFEYFIRGDISSDELYEKVKDIDEKNRKNIIIINDTNCVVTDYTVNYDHMHNLYMAIGNSIYYSYCFTDRPVPEVFKSTVISKNDCELLLSYFDAYTSRGLELMESIRNEISKTVDSII